MEADQRCYRHPDRKAGVICQRCDRPICPDCMHQASVGFHCPECTRSHGQRVVRARNLQGGGLFVTNLLIAVNVAVFVYGLGGNLDTKASVINDGGLLANAFDGRKLIGVANGEWWRIFTSGFLHANAIHIGLNMFVLYQLGRLMEPVLGRIGFAVVYVCSLVSGALGVLLIEQANVPTVGASGAIFGMMGAAVAAMRSRGINPFQTGLGTTILLNLLITFSIPGISIGGHIGGLIGGFIAGWIVTDYAPQHTRNQAAPLVAVVVLTGALTAGCLLVA